jgi:hypothetical protein
MIYGHIAASTGRTAYLIPLCRTLDEVGKQYDGVVALPSPLVYLSDLAKYWNEHGNRTLASEYAEEMLTDNIAFTVQGSVLHNSLRDFIGRHRQDIEALTTLLKLGGSSLPTVILQRNKPSAFDGDLEDIDPDLRQRLRTICAFKNNRRVHTDVSIAEYKYPRHTGVEDDVQLAAHEEAVYRRPLVEKNSALEPERTSTLGSFNDLMECYSTPLEI